LKFQLSAFGRENFCEPLHGSRDQRVGIFDCPSRLVDETSLDLGPPIAKIAHFLFGQ
jgi:hypothetical protein